MENGGDGDDDDDGALALLMPEVPLLLILMMLMEALPLEAGVLLMDDPLLRYCMTPGSCVRRGTADVIISDQVTGGSRGSQRPRHKSTLSNCLEQATILHSQQKAT